jgi:hypothetical protein
LEAGFEEARKKMVEANLSISNQRDKKIAVRRSGYRIICMYIGESKDKNMLSQNIRGICMKLQIAMTPAMSPQN